MCNRKLSFICLIRISNDSFDRVVNPPKKYWTESRYSIPFFLHPVGSMSLNVLDSCIDENNPKKYKDINANEFLIQRLKDIGVL